MSLNAQDVSSVALFLAKLGDASRQSMVDLGVEYDEDGSPQIAAYMDGEPIAFISLGGSGYEIIGMP